MAILTDEQKEQLKPKPTDKPKEKVLEKDKAPATRACRAPIR